MALLEPVRTFENKDLNYIHYTCYIHLHFQLSKDLTCLVQFEFVDLYIGLNWKKKYHSPTDFGFALKVSRIIKFYTFTRDIVKSQSTVKSVFSDMSRDRLIFMAFE